MKPEKQQDYEVLACDGQDRYGPYVQHYAFIGGFSPADVEAAIRNARALGKKNVRAMTQQEYHEAQIQDGAKRHIIDQAMPISALKFNDICKQEKFTPTPSEGLNLLRVSGKLGFGLMVYYARLQAAAGYQHFKIITTQQTCSSEILKMCRKSLEKYQLAAAV